MKKGKHTSGGECQSLNAAMTGVDKTMYNKKRMSVGFSQREEQFLELPEHLSNISMSLMRKGAIRLQA